MNGGGLPSAGFGIRRTRISISSGMPAPVSAEQKQIGIRCASRRASSNGVVQLLGLQVLALLQVDLHQRLVHLDHLVDDLAVGLLHRREVGALAGRG
jgi:hypothetical protein